MRAVPGAYFNPLSPLDESFSLVGMMFDEMQSRTVSDEILNFLENLPVEEQRRQYYADAAKFHGWFEIAVKMRNADMVSQLVKFVHETPAPPEWDLAYETIHVFGSGNTEKTPVTPKHWGLTSYHYHCLLRVFSYQGDIPSLQQLVQIMQRKSIEERRKSTETTAEESQGETNLLYWRKRYLLTSTVNANTIAWLMWMNWSSGSLETALRIFEDVSTGTEDRATSRNLFLSPQDGLEDEWIRKRLPLHCAPLSMLIFICAQQCVPMSGLVADAGELVESKSRAENRVPSAAVAHTSIPPELVVIVTATKRLLDIPLTASDYVQLLLAVLNNHRIFQRIQRILYNHRRSRELHSFQSHTSFNFLVEVTHGVFPAHHSRDDMHGISPHFVVPLVLRALRGAFGMLQKDPAEIRPVGFVQSRQSTLNGWVRCVLDAMLDDCTEPAAVFDALVSWAEVHRRPTFSVNICNYLYERIQTPRDVQQVVSSPSFADLRARLVRRHVANVVPKFTTVSILGDVIRNFPAGRVAKYMLPRLVFFTSLCLSADSYKEDTRWYLRAQQLMFARTSTELLAMVKKLLDTKYADESGISFAVIREGLRCCLDACVWLTPANPVIGKDALNERWRWWIFNDARDIALTLYGFAPNINEKVQEVFERNASPRPCKSEDKMHAEFRRILRLDTSCTKAPLLPEEFIRETSTWTGMSMSFVPPHWKHGDGINPFPHVFLGNTRPADAREGKPDDPFPEVYALIRNSNSRQTNWHLSDKDTVTRLLRCLLHRLEFEKAVELMRSAIKVMGYGQKVDRDIQRFFTEIGDPSGSIAFKLASGIMDGEVNQSKTRHYSSAGNPAS